MEIRLKVFLINAFTFEVNKNILEVAISGLCNKTGA